MLNRMEDINRVSLKLENYRWGASLKHGAPAVKDIPTKLYQHLHVGVTWLEAPQPTTYRHLQTGQKNRNEGPNSTTVALPCLSQTACDRVSEWTSGRPGRPSRRQKEVTDTRAAIKGSLDPQFGRVLTLATRVLDLKHVAVGSGPGSPLGNALFRGSTSHKHPTIPSPRLALRVTRWSVPSQAPTRAPWAMMSWQPRAVSVQMGWVY